MPFKFLLKQSVLIKISGEVGIVKGRSDYSDSKDQYYVHYVDSKGCVHDKWFFESELQAAKTKAVKLSKKRGN